ncbi:hypothetical protein JVX96_00435 [Variovorax sp. PDNC026]|uniref:hypothetical protein n=1 Tax=Variovorax sp. PDNC026 TaxID=2811425 RepID=UPI001965636D|nr:hypothetical protein [Variovorax sp. PDNC026]QRY31832.1 hypothetical protein JVX96_00435 [Variovorax sp. PDNC026]
MSLLHHPLRVALDLRGKQLGHRSQTNSYFGIKPLCAPNGRFLRTVDSIKTLIEESKQ